jgi:hypothetical protein
MRERLIESSWRALLAPQLALPLSVLLGGVLLHSMNVLITATLLPSIVSDVGGSNLILRIRFVGVCRGTATGGTQRLASS